MHGVSAVIFDPQSGVTSSRTNTIYALISAMGVYRSTNAGGTWSKINSGSPRYGVRVFVVLLRACVHCVVYASGSCVVRVPVQIAMNVCARICVLVCA